MPDIQTFRAIRYNSDRVRIENAIAPPYDVISADEHAALLARSPFNIVRIELPQENSGADKYETAGTLLQSWLRDGVLRSDETDGFYLYDQEFTNASGKRVMRRGFFAACRLEEFSRGNILPHEKTLSGPKADRLKLMHTVKANVSPIFALYQDHEGHVQQLLDRAAGQTLADFVDAQNVRHLVRPATGGRVMDDVREVMLHKRAFIADGHHRYETALKYRDELRLKFPDASPDAPWNFILMYFAAMEDEGMEIQPTHRLLHSVKSFDRTTFESALREQFEITQFNSLDDALPMLASAGADGLLFAYPNASSCIVAKLRGSVHRAKLFGEEVPEVLQHLSVAVLHTLVLKNILKISDEAQLRRENLDYVHTLDEVRSALAAATTQCAVILNPTSMDQLRATAEAGVPMPQKSTYFYPKLATGFVMHSLE